MQVWRSSTSTRKVPPKRNILFTNIQVTGNSAAEK